MSKDLTRAQCGAHTGSPAGQPRANMFALQRSVSAGLKSSWHPKVPSAVLIVCDQYAPMRGTNCCSEYKTVPWASEMTDRKSGGDNGTPRVEEIMGPLP